MTDEPEVSVNMPEPETGGEASQEEAPDQTVSEAPVESEGSDQPQEESGEPEIKSVRGQKRIQELANQRNEAVAEVETLRQTLAPSGETKPVRQQEQEIPWMQQPDPLASLGDEVTPDQYRQHVAAMAENIVEMRLAQRDAETKRKEAFESDLSHLEKTFPELAGEIQDKRLVEAIKKANENYKIALKANPDARYRDFVEPIMEARTGGVETGRETASAKLAEQQANSAVTPGANSVHRVSSEDELAGMLERGEITADEAVKKYPDLFPSE